MYAPDHARIATPLGPVALIAEGEQLTRIVIGHDVPRGTSLFLRHAAEQFEQWFAGERRSFDLAIAPAATPRGAELRAGLIAVGYGTTQSYGGLARALGSSPRAIGQLCARNPLPILVPCHRILNADGSPGAYSAGDGTATKQWLLTHERNGAAT